MKITKYFKRENGSEVKLVGELMVGRGLNVSVSHDVFTRADDKSPWSLISTPAHYGYDKTLQGMSVDDYVAKGRNPIFYFVSPADLLKISAELMAMHRNWLKDPFASA